MKDIEEEILSKCSRIFPEISICYDPLKAVIKIFEFNCIFPSTTNLICFDLLQKETFPPSKEDVNFHLKNFWSVSIQNAISNRKIFYIWLTF
jgi:hypothetical protein